MKRPCSIQEYRLTENVLHGNFRDALENYDLIDIIVLNLGKKPTTHKLLNLFASDFYGFENVERKKENFERRLRFGNYL